MSFQRFAPEYWFLNDRNNPDTSLSLFTSGNTLVPLIDGASYLNALHRLIASAGPGDYLFIAGWRMDVDQEMVPELAPEANPGSIVTVLDQANNRGAAVRVLLSAHRTHRNGPVYQRFKELGIPCRLDRRHSRLGSSHQKLVSALIGGEPHSFCGGIDLAASRRDYPSHPLGGWHDLQVYVRGPACQDLDTTFRERWEYAGKPGSTGSLPPREPLPKATATGPHHVQVLRTYPCAQGYPFAPRGEFSARLATLKAIGLAEDLVYIENQYIVSQEFAQALESRLIARPNLRAILVVPAKPNLVLRPFLLRQQAILRRLSQLAPGRFAAYQLRNTNPDRTGQQIYVHSKLIMVDDRWLQVGSMNLNRRSLTHDAEVCLAVATGDTPGPASDDTRGESDNFARDLRASLWSEHLALAPDQPSLSDPIRGFELWEARAQLPEVPATPHTPATPPFSRTFGFFWKAVNRLTEGLIDPSGECR